MYRQTDGWTDGRMDGRTDGLTDELIWGGLGNLRFLQETLDWGKRGESVLVLGNKYFCREDIGDDQTTCFSCL